MGTDMETPLLLEHDGEMLLGEYDHGVRRPFHPESAGWQAFHALFYLLGGVTFIAGTLVLFFPALPGCLFWSALLYTIGSCGFLAVDVQEFMTFEGPVLRANICMSLTGSALYVVGSVGYFPPLIENFPLIGIYGFILGSTFLAWSQIWKTLRIGGIEAPRGFKLSNLATKDAFTAAGVELSAGIGATCFLFGTIAYDAGPLDGPNSILFAILCVWTVGSVAFTAGGTFLAYRHFGMRVI